MTTAYEHVRNNFTFPFELYPFQQAAVNELAPLDRSGLYLDPGLGKTAVSTHCALHKDKPVIAILPPILITSWARWLAKVKRKDGTALDVLTYQGSPKQRKEMNLIGHDFVLMSMQIFKRDQERILQDFHQVDLHLLLDEAHCIKDVGTANYKTFRDFSYERSAQLLTGTPLNNPMDAYAYTRLVAPGVYRTLSQFERVHVAVRDFFGKPIEYANLELLSENLLVNSVRKTKEEVLIDLPPCIVTQMDYELTPPHAKLYKRLVEEQLLKLPDGDKIDATQATALYHALGQIIMQWHHFGQNDELKSAGYDLLEEVLDELGDKKLVVFANYQRTNAEIQRRYNCPGVWGGVSAKEKQIAIDRFIDDPNCRLITLMPTSGGVGIDGLQHVCTDVLYLEPPIAVMHFVQSLSRVHRDGQTKVVTVRLATALSTIQQYLVRRLSEKEALVQPLQGSRAMLKAALFGEPVPTNTYQGVPVRTSTYHKPMQINACI